MLIVKIILKFLNHENDEIEILELWKKKKKK